MQDKIIAAIAAYLEKETHLSNKYGETFVQFMHPVKIGYNRAEYCEEIATKIATAIAPVVNEKDLPYTDLFGHMANEHGLTLTNTELGDIIHIARGK